MHGAPPFKEPPFVQYTLDGKYSRFTAQVAMNDTGGRWCKIEFVVLADGKERWRSRSIGIGDPAESCDVDVRNVRTLTLQVRTFGPEAGAHGAWIEPRFTK
jgi:hypothetical protein